ncbi:TPA: MFS transporter [Candidatus Scatousia excrementigallinarum]|uniref:MFS transporter n=1 Tax=Candidatus Scatousia excrementigallinarum TaxID=2840935 RepID=A0A9D1JN52_9BACT|nr:MFS transporter [Candidatus Scatousia excrementigallinarum]
MKNINEKTPLIWLSSAHFVNDIYTGMLNPIMPFIALKLGISMAIATIIVSLSHIFASLLQPVFGFFADNITRRAFIFWGLIATSLFISLAPSANNVFTLLIFIILGSLGSSFFHPQALGFTVRFSTGDVIKNMGIFIGLGTLGYSLGPIVSAAVAQFIGLHSMPFLAIPGLMVASLMFCFVPKISSNAETKTHNDFIQTFKDIFSNRRLNILNIIAILKTLVTTSTSILLPFLWRNMGYKPFKIGIALFAFSFAAGIGSFISRTVENKAGARAVLAFSMTSTFPLMLMFALFYKTFPVAAFAVFVLMGFCTGMAMPVTMVMAQTTLPQYKSIIGGFINGFSWGVVAIALSVIGFIAQAKGIIPVLLIITLIPALASYPVLERLFTKSCHK